jgi:hypothetical protein
MQEILRYIKDYLKGIDYKTFVASSLFTGLIVFLNYFFGINNIIENQNSEGMVFISRYLIFLVAFAFPYLFCFLPVRKYYSKEPVFLLFLFLSPAIFAAKMSLPIEFHFTGQIKWNDFWNQLVYWPTRLIFIIAILFVIRKKYQSGSSFYGFTTKNFSLKPYMLCLLLVIPLVAAASTQPDFLQAYPRLKNVYESLEKVNNPWFYYLLYELSYGSDFVYTELFFRGFLVLAIIKIAGKDAILPMAGFYCAIHFGKPLAECISSYFGGTFLGIIVYNTRSIIGPLILHLALAWLMELGGYLGNTFF